MISSRVELCKRLSAEFGWTVDHYALGRNTGFPTGRKNATEMYDESRMASGTTNIENGIQCRDYGQSKRKEAKEK